MKKEETRRTAGELSCLSCWAKACVTIHVCNVDHVAVPQNECPADQHERTISLTTNRGI